MKTNIFLILLSALACSLVAVGCGGEEDPVGSGDDSELTSDNNSDPIDTGNPEVCNINEFETFDTGVPAGWTVIGGMVGGSGSGSGSGTGTGSGGPVVTDPAKTWHHTAVEAQTAPPAGMTGGYMTVGGFTGMNESFISDYYTLGTCNTVTLMFTHYFDDYGASTGKMLDRGEVWFMGDAPPWTKIATYDSNPNKAPVTETVDLTNYVAGMSLFQVKFVFADDNQGNYGWSIDDVKITGAE